MSDRVTAPLGARTVAVSGRSSHGPYVVIECRDAEGPRPEAGQFYMLSTVERWGGGEDERPFLPRAFSVMRAAPGPELTLAFLLEAIGPGTSRLCELGPVDRLRLVGPLGRGFAPPRDGRRALLVGGGVGIAPLAIWQDRLGPAAVVLLGFRDGAHAEGAALLDAPQLATDDGSHGRRGLVTALLTAELDRDPHATVYACGPPPMLEAVRALCTERDVPAQLALESGMACGFGACFGCVVPTRDGYIRVCVDGPVIEAAALSEETFATPGQR